MNHYSHNELEGNSYSLRESLRYEPSFNRSYQSSIDSELYDDDENSHDKNDSSAGKLLKKFFGIGFSGGKRKRINHTDKALNHVYLALNRAYKNRDFLEVSLPGDSTIYQSILLEIDPEEKTVLIDELFPSTVIGLPGQKMRFSLRQAGGRSIIFEASVKERHEFDGSPVYVISMPQTLDENQRRVAFRMGVPRGEVIDSSFIGPDKQAYSAKLRDVSSGGVCIETNGEMIKALRAGDSLKNTSFEFAGMDIVCDLTVKNLVDTKDEVDGSSKTFKRIGAQFDNLSVATRRQLEQSIMQLQREQLRIASHSREQWLN